MKLKTFLKIAQALESTGSAWFTRCGPTGEDAIIYFRVNGYDNAAWSSAWSNARAAEVKFHAKKIFTRTEPDLQSGSIAMRINKIYKPIGAL